MMTDRQRVLLEALDAIDEPRSALDLYDIYADELIPYYESINHLQAGLSYFRRKGLCENGLSEIVDGRFRLTWKLTELGQDALKSGVISNGEADNENGMPPINPPIPKPLDIEAIKQELSAMLDRHFSKHEFNIDRIAAKIAALDVIGSSSFIADDLRGLLNELAEELQKIQEAA